MIYFPYSQSNVYVPIQYWIFWLPNIHSQSWTHWFENSNEDDAIYEHSKSWTHILEFFAVSLISSKVIKGFVFSRRSQNYWLTGGLRIVNDGPRRMDDGHLRLKRNFQASLSHISVCTLGWYKWGRMLLT